MAVLAWICLIAGAAGLLMVHVGMRTWIVIISVVCIVGVAIGALAVSSAIYLNREGEFVDDVTGAVNYLGLAPIFLSWVLVVSSALGLALTIVVWAARWLRMLVR